MKEIYFKTKRAYNKATKGLKQERGGVDYHNGRTHGCYSEDVKTKYLLVSASEFKEVCSHERGE
jgi:hypothetical protein